MKDLDRIVVGDELRAARKRAGMTLIQAAAASGICRAGISKIECGDQAVSLEQFHKLLGIYKDSPARFYRRLEARAA